MDDTRLIDSLNRTIELLLEYHDREGTSPENKQLLTEAAVKLSTLIGDVILMQAKDAAATLEHCREINLLKQA